MKMGEEKECFHETSFTDKEGKVITMRVPVVQELARQGIQSLPERFIATTESVSSFQTQDRLEVLPMISMAILRDGSESKERNEELNKLANAARDLGLFLIVEHGIPCEVLSGVKEVVKGFFDLSFQEKKAAVGTYASVDNMGYGKNFVKSDQTLDWIDRLTMKAAPPPAGADRNLRVWPQKPPNFREAMEKYVAEARAMMDNLLVALGEALSPENHDAFLKYFDPKESEIKVRVNYYPKCPRPDLVIGINPHSDAAALTLLMQLGCNQGLQVLDHNKWLNVLWPQDQLLVIAGDLLEIMSNGLIESPWHRVVPQRDVDRCSIALFYNPPSKAQIEPIKVPASDSGGGYKKVVVEDYVQNYYKISPVKEKTPINFAKVNSSQ